VLYNALAQGPGVASPLAPIGYGSLPTEKTMIKKWTVTDILTGTEEFYDTEDDALAAADAILADYRSDCRGVARRGRTPARVPAGAFGTDQPPRKG